MGDVHGVIIKVIGAGGAGGNACTRIIDMGVQGIEVIAVNTDCQALNKCKADIKIRIGKKNKGLGAGANPDIGREAAEDSKEDILNSLICEDGTNADLVILTAGMGGGTGTGALPVIAEIAKSTGALILAVVSTPFTFELSRKMKIATEGIRELEKHVDCLIIIPNSKLEKVMDKKVTFREALKEADETLRSAIQGITNLIILPGEINLDFSDIKTILKGKGRGWIGLGSSPGGASRAIDAVREAITNPLLDNNLNGATSVLINFTAGEDITLAEMNDALNFMMQNVHPDAKTIFGATFDDNISPGCHVTVLATGFECIPEENYNRDNNLPKDKMNKKKINTFETKEITLPPFLEARKKR